MILNEDNYKKVINGFPKAKWKPLLDLIPEIEKMNKFGKLKREGSSLPYWRESLVISRFRKIVYDLPIIINFDWSKWEESRKIINDKNFDFNSINIPTKCKIITLIVRNDRFCDGALIFAFESDLIVKILKSIENQLK